MADVGDLTITIRVADIGLTREHLRALEKAIACAPESFGDTPYGITEQERDFCERLVGLLKLSLNDVR